MKYGANDALIVIDIQNDFCEGGSLAVPQGSETVGLANELMQEFPHVILTQDWHPSHHSSFASSHPGQAPFSMITMPYGPQTLWPDHCIIGSKGAEFHDKLEINRAELIIRKGFRQPVDSYSAFFENDHQTPTGLGGYLKERGFKRLFIIGLAFDYCVRYSAEDAKALGFETYVIEKACRAIDLNGSVAETKASFKEKQIELL